MRIPRRISRTIFLTAAPLLLTAAGCDDDDDPIGPVGLTAAQVYTQCSRATIGDATTEQTLAGTLNENDCWFVDPAALADGGFIEGYYLPQASFGGEQQVTITLDAPFDGVLYVLGPNGDVLAMEDNDIGGDFGMEELTLTFDLDPNEPQYFIGVYAYEGEPSGAYVLTALASTPAP